MKSIKAQISDFIQTSTSETLYAQNYHKIGISASMIAEKFFIDRSNASRILNQLFHDGKLCKKVGRPTLYISTDAINKVFPNNTVPKIISASAQIESFLTTRKAGKEKAYLFTFQFRGIGYSLNESMYAPIEKARRILLYPDQKKLLFINGKPSQQKKEFLDNIIKYLHTIGYLSKNMDSLIITSKTMDDVHHQLCENLKKSKSHKTTIITIKEILTIHDFENLQTILKHQLSSLSESVMFFINIEMDNCSDYINALYPIITIPQYFDLTAKEKVEYVFSYILQEANTIHRTISFTKNLVCCLVLCNMIGSLGDLRNLIHQTCINAYDAHAKPNQELLLNLEDLPNEILSGIEGTTSYMEHIDHIFHLFSYTTFYAFPQMESIELNMMLSSVVNEKQEIMRQCDEEIDSLLNTCKHDISSFKKLYIDDSVKQDPLYMKLMSSMENLQIIKKPYDMILSFHLYHAYKNLENGTYQEKSVLQDRSEFMLFSNDCEKILAVLEPLSKEPLPIYERMYINTFITHCQQIVKKSKVGIIFCLSDKRLSDVYRTTMNQRYGDNFSIASSISFAKFYDAYEDNYKTLKNELSMIDSHKGIILLTDTYLPFNLIHRLKAEIASDIKITTNLSDTQLRKIHEIYISDQIDFDDFHPLEYTAGKAENNSALSHDENRNLMEVLNQALQGQLSFLDSYKIIPLLKSVFYNIIQDLGMEYTNNLLIAFLMHSCFLLERTIKDESLPYKSLNKLQRQNSSIYNSVYKHFKVIESYFNCKIKETELAYLIEMFADAQLAEKKD